MKKININLLWTLILIFVISGCSDTDDGIGEENPVLPEEQINPNPAGNNEEILNQNIWGQAKSSIWETVILDNEIYAVGYKNQQHVISNINSLGQEVWSRIIDIKPLAISKQSNKLIVLGKKANDGMIITYDTNGSELGSLEIFNSNEDIELSAIDFVNHFEGEDYFLVSGSATSNGVVKPIIVPIKIDLDESIKYLHNPIKIDLPNHNVESMVFKENTIYLSLNKHLTGEDSVNNISVIKLNPIIDNGLGGSLVNQIVDYSIEWQNELFYEDGFPTHSSIGQKQMILEGSKLYVIGSTKSLKNPAPSSGGYWDSGFVACLDIGGNVLWRTKVELSNKSEILNSGVFYNNNLYVVGKHSSLIYTATSSSFSNGMLTKIDTNGNVIYSKSFGESNQASGFNSIEIINNQVGLFGYTNGKNGDFQNWYVQVSP